MISAKPSLKFCLIMDIIGMAGMFIPVVGEWFDIVWAPVSALVFYFYFKRGKYALIGSIVEFLEELLPYTDFIPTFTIAYYLNRIKQKQ